jgi:hypothetical protein
MREVQASGTSRSSGAPMMQFSNLTRQFKCTNAAVQRKWPIGMTQDSSGALTRQFRNATLRSSVALNASIHHEHARIFTFVWFIFTTVEISIYTKWKFTLNKRKVRLQEIKRLNFVKIQFDHNRSSVTHPKQFSCMWEAVEVLCFFSKRKSYRLKSFLYVMFAQVNHINT